MSFKSDPADPRWFKWQVTDEVKEVAQMNPDATFNEILESMQTVYGKYCTLTVQDIAEILGVK